MRIALYRCLWGVIKPAGGALSIPDALAAVKALPGNYRGVEVPIKVIMEFGKSEFVSLLNRHDLNVIPMIFSDGPVAPAWGRKSPLKSAVSHPVPKPDAKSHVDVLKAQCYEILDAIPPARLTKITAHSGLDSFAPDERAEFFNSFIEWQYQTLPPHLQINHETHRHRILYSAWATRDVLSDPATVPRHTEASAKVAVQADGIDGKAERKSAVERLIGTPQLTLAADYSHHVTVAEADPESCASGGALHKAVMKFSPFIRHVHARYGYDQGPQIPDPRAPEYQPYVNAHDAWWADIVRTAARNGLQELTVTPEHGPAPYQQCLPYTGVPTANVWDINSWVGERFMATAKKALASAKK